MRPRSLPLATVLSAVWMLGPLATPCRAQAVVLITVPAGVSFPVTDISSPTSGSPSPTTIAFSALTLPLGKAFTISVRADASSFTPPSGGAIPASSVSWTASAASGTPSAGALSASAYTLVYRTVANATSGSVSIDWTLAALDGLSGLRAGSHLLTVRWKMDQF